MVFNMIESHSQSSRLQIVCPNCSARYIVAEELAKDSSVGKFHCSKCDQLFTPSEAQIESAPSLELEPENGAQHGAALDESEKIPFVRPTTSRPPETGASSKSLVKDLEISENVEQLGSGAPTNLEAPSDDQPTLPFPKKKKRSAKKSRRDGAAQIPLQIGIPELSPGYKSGATVTHNWEKEIGVTPIQSYSSLFFISVPLLVMLALLFTLSQVIVVSGGKPVVGALALPIRTPPAAPAELSLSALKIRPEASDELLLTGSLKNLSSRPMTRIMLQVGALDANGVLLTSSELPLAAFLVHSRQEKLPAKMQAELQAKATLGESSIQPKEQLRLRYLLPNSLVRRARFINAQVYSAASSEL